MVKKTNVPMPVLEVDILHPKDLPDPSTTFEQFRFPAKQPKSGRTKEKKAEHAIVPSKLPSIRSTRNKKPSYSGFPEDQSTYSHESSTSAPSRTVSQQRKRLQRIIRGEEDDEDDDNNEDDDAQEDVEEDDVSEEEDAIAHHNAGEKRSKDPERQHPLRIPDCVRAACEDLGEPVTVLFASESKGEVRPYRDGETRLSCCSTT